MKTRILRTLSLRAKFKSYDTIELVVMNSQTNEIFVTNIKFNFEEAKQEPLNDEEQQELIEEELENGN